jgi:hypothetical protein
LVAIDIARSAKDQTAMTIHPGVNIGKIIDTDESRREIHLKQF